MVINLTNQITEFKFEELTYYTNEWVKMPFDNNLPEYLEQLLEESSTHATLIEKKKLMCIGDGLISKTEKPLLKKITEDYFKKCNDKEHLNKITEKVFNDYLIQNMAAFNIIWSKNGEYISKIHHLPINKLRLGTKNLNGEIENYYYSNDWKLIQRKENKPVPLQPFVNLKEMKLEIEQLDDSDFKDQQLEKWLNIPRSQVILINNYSYGKEYYSYPTYLSNKGYIELEGIMSNFSYNYIKNGGFLSLIINTNSLGTEQEQEMFFDNLQEQVEGGDGKNAGKILVIQGNGSDKTEIIIPDVSNMSDIIEKMVKILKDNIIECHQIPPLLAGIKESGQLGSNNEFVNTYSVFFNDIIKPIQNTILNELNKIMNINNLSEVEISNNIPIKFIFSENILNQILTKNEMREATGYEPIENEIKE